MLPPRNKCNEPRVKMQIKEIILQNYSKNTSRNIYTPGFCPNVSCTLAYVGFASTDAGKTFKNSTENVIVQKYTK